MKELCNGSTNIFQKKGLWEGRIETYFRKGMYGRTVLKHISENGIIERPH
jgi:hypothetical protein